MDTTTAVIVIVIALVLAAGVIIAIVSRLGRAGREGVLAASRAGEEAAITPRPSVAEFHVRDDRALVYFDVPLPPGEVDNVLKDLLVHEAVEVVREKRHNLPIDQVTRLVVFGRRNGEFGEVGTLKLEEPGRLPPPVSVAPLAQVGKLGFDPLAEQFESDSATHPGVSETVRSDELPPIAEELRLPRAIDVALRAQGIDPSVMSAGDLVVALLRFVGYVIEPGRGPSTYYASRSGVRTFIRVVDHEAGQYPVLEDRLINEFIVDFVSAGADRGILVTDKYGPFGVYDKERREPRARFVTRERLQRFVDALSLG